MIEQLTLFGRSQYVETGRRARRRWQRVRLAPPAPALHEHSLAAREELEEALGGRKRAILEWLLAHGPATDREIKDALLGEAADMNTVRHCTPNTSSSFGAAAP